MTLPITSAQRLHEQGMAVRQITRELALSRDTVRCWLRSEQPEFTRPRMHSLDPWRAVPGRR